MDKELVDYVTARFNEQSKRALAAIELVTRLVEYNQDLDMEEEAHEDFDQIVTELTETLTDITQKANNAIVAIHGDKLQE